MSAPDLVNPVEASIWWRQTNPTGAVLNKLMVLFILVPIGLILKNFYMLSVVVFAFMVPYGFFLRHLAVGAVRRHLEKHPEQREEFEREGIISEV